MKSFNYRKLTILLAFLLGGLSVHSQDLDLYGLLVKRAAFGGSGSAEVDASIMDEEGNFYVAGMYFGTVNFSDTLCLAHMSTSVGAFGNPFVVKFDKNGSFQWLVTGTSNKPITFDARAYALDYANGKLLISVWFNGHRDNVFPWSITLQGSTSPTNKKTMTIPSLCGSGAGGGYHFGVEAGRTQGNGGILHQAD